MGKRDTKSNRQKKVEKQKGKLGKNKFSEAAQTAADEAGLIQSDEDEEVIIPTEETSAQPEQKVYNGQYVNALKIEKQINDVRIEQYERELEEKPLEEVLGDINDSDPDKDYMLNLYDRLKSGEEPVPYSTAPTEDPLLTAEETQPKEVGESQDEDGNNEGFEPEPEPQDDMDIVPQDKQKEELAYVPEVDLTPGEIEQGEVEDRRVSEMDKSTEWIPQDLDSDTGAYSFDDTNRLDGEAAVLDGNGNQASEEDRIAIDQDIEGLLKSEG